MKASCLSFIIPHSAFIISKSSRPDGLRVAGALYAPPARSVRHRAQGDEPGGLFKGKRR
jgi:hypothetical protein